MVSMPEDTALTPSQLGHSKTLHYSSGSTKLEQKKEG